MSIKIEENFDISKLTTFQIGGKINKVYFPINKEEFVTAIKEEPNAKVFGNLSNTLISSDGYNGTVILTSKMNEIKVDGNKIYAECGVKGPFLSQRARQFALSGMEFMIGFPGSIGGEIYMNASARGQAMGDIVDKVTLYSKNKGVFTLTKEEMKFSYRSSICQKKNLIVLGAEFIMSEKPEVEIVKDMRGNILFRKNHQPNLVLSNAGSIFKNPEGDSAGRLLDEAGVKGLSVGGVRVWENHANFIVNFDNGTSKDVLELMLMMYNKVKEKFGIELRPEIIFLGGNNSREVEICKILKMK